MKFGIVPPFREVHSIEKLFILCKIPHSPGERRDPSPAFTTSPAHFTVRKQFCPVYGPDLLQYAVSRRSGHQSGLQRMHRPRGHGAVQCNICRFMIVGRDVSPHQVFPVLVVGKVLESRSPVNLNPLPAKI